MLIKFLGTGTSHGIPVVGCDCPTCTSDNRKNRRYRSSIFIEINEKKILIDTPPELRLQLLQNNISLIDAVLFTHSHADHIMGFDDIRAINRISEGEIPCFGNRETIEGIKKCFNYIFNYTQVGGGIPRVKLRSVDPSDFFYAAGSKILPLPVRHGKLAILGYKINDMAYITDCSKIPAPTMSLLTDIKLLILDALRYKEHPTHFNIEQALAVNEQLRPRETYLTHISHHIEHEKVSRELPENVFLAYDGLTVEMGAD